MPEQEAADNPTQVQEPATNNGQATQAAPESTFFNGDVNSLPDQLKETYNSMLRDYRSKTEAVANEKKDIESIKKKAEFYDTISSDKAFVDYWDGLSKKEQQQRVDEAINVSDEDIATGAHVKKLQSEINGLKKMNQETETRRYVSDMRSLLSDYINETDKEGKLLRPDFDEVDEMPNGGSFVEFFLRKNPPKGSSEAAIYQSIENAYKSAKDTYSRIFTKGKEAGLGRVQEKVNNASEPPTGSVRVSDAKIDYKTLSPREQAEEAVRLAREGKRVAR